MTLRITTVSRIAAPQFFDWEIPMKKTFALAAGLLASTAVLSAPAVAQDQEEGTSARDVFGRVLNAILGPEEREEEAEATTEAVVEEAEQSLLESVIAHDRRADDMARDQYRHPAETLEFFGVEPDMKVGEYAPGGGWYTRILAPYLAEDGQYVGLFFNTDDVPFSDEAKENIAKASAGFPERISEWTGISRYRFASKLMNEVDEADEGTFDRVLIFRSLHGLSNWNMLDSEIKTIRSLLKDDGMLGVVQHRAAANANWAYSTGPRGYMSENSIIGLMDFYGFELAGRSEINANPYDTANHEGGVWYLPPTFRGVEEGDDAARAARQQIGESDRMTLLFRKKA